MGILKFSLEFKIQNLRYNWTKLKTKRSKNTSQQLLLYCLTLLSKSFISLGSSGTSSEWPQYHFCKMSQIISLSFNFRRRSYDIFNISMDTHLYHDDHRKEKLSRYVDSLKEGTTISRNRLCNICVPLKNTWKHKILSWGA